MDDLEEPKNYVSPTCFAGMSICQSALGIDNFKEGYPIASVGHFLTSAACGFQSGYQLRTNKRNRRSFLAAAIGCFISAGDKVRAYRHEEKDFLRNQALLDLAFGGYMLWNHYKTTIDHYNNLAEKKDKERIKKDFRR